MVLHDIGWNTYERLLADHENHSAPRFTYDRGELEIMSPSPEHEALNRSIALLVEFLAAELGVDVYDLGSTTSRTRSEFVARSVWTCSWTRHRTW